jgi:exodeoxyribonuclease VII small subunit
MPKKEDTFDYAEKSGELEAILQRLQSSDIQLTEATKLYEQGTKLVDDIEAYLKKAENTVRKHTAEG